MHKNNIVDIKTQWNKIYKQQGKNYGTPLDYIPDLTELFKKHNIKKILDLGCGSGKHLVYLAKQGFDAYGIDISKEGIRLTQERLKENKLKANLKVGSIYKKLPYQNNFFDAIISLRVIHHEKIENIRKAIKEIERVLKPKGLIFVTVHSRIPKKIRVIRIKMLNSRTYLPEEGKEKGIIHYIFNKKLLREEFKNFKIHNLWIDYGKKAWERYYRLLGELKNLE